MNAFLPFSMIACTALAILAVVRHPISHRQMIVGLVDLVIITGIYLAIEIPFQIRVRRARRQATGSPQA